jgi:hypothetical protein
MHVYNAARSFTYYEECVEMGFPVSCLHCPPWMPDWYLSEWLSYIERNQVKCISFSFQTIRMMGLHVLAAQRYNEALPDDAAVIVFGVASVQNASMLSYLYGQRNLVFSNVGPYAKAAFFRLATGDPAPPGWTKGDTFAWSTKYEANIYGNLIDSAKGVAAQPSRRGRRSTSSAQARAETRRAAAARRSSRRSSR